MKAPRRETAMTSRLLLSTSFIALLLILAIVSFAHP